MKRAALGFRMHSGWGVLVAVAGGPDSIEIVERRRIVVTDSQMPGAIQPYHHAANLEIQEAESHIRNCAAVSEGIAIAAIEHVLHELDLREYRIAGSAVLLASGRPLPPLAKILAAHPLIHTAEGEFFRNSVRSACEQLQLPVETMRERDVEERVRAAFGTSADRLKKKVESAGRAIGPPWTKDHKVAALAALLMISREPATRREVRQGT
ncbi:MAG TPA: hypothetical protein VH350_15470 [Candidatus Sulfotelmatobacter sp.]|jgi:hypothetical protein|nr:hypothetical protein [Candidatus Sulfotelmatobacter sp.]